MKEKFCLQSLANEAIKCFKYMETDAIDITVIRSKNDPNNAYMTIQSKFDLVPQCYMASFNLEEK